jgi:hypothetical protein
MYKEKIMKLLVMSAFTALLAVTGANAQPAADDAAAASQHELQKVRGSFRETWVHPEADLTQYDKIMWGDSKFEFRDVGPARKYRSSMHRSSSKSEFGVLESEQSKFEVIVSEAFEKEISKSKRFEVVSQAGPGTLQVHGAVLDIVSHVPPEFIGRSEIYLSSIGTATLVIIITDAETGQVLAYAEERRKITPAGGGSINEFSMPSSSVSQWSDIKRWARSSAGRLRKELEKAQKGR